MNQNGKQYDSYNNDIIVHWNEFKYRETAAHLTLIWVYYETVFFSLSKWKWMWYHLYFPIQNYMLYNVHVHAFNLYVENCI